MLYKIKFDIVELEQEDYHLLAKGTIAGQSVRIVLDTGASRSCLDINFIQNILPELTMENNEGISAGIGGDNFVTKVADIPDFKVGRFHLDIFPEVALIDLNVINMAYRKLKMKPVQMILGSDFFVKYQAVLDYSKKILTIQQRKITGNHARPYVATK